MPIYQVNKTEFDDFWTSGTNAGCQSNYTWCSSEVNFVSKKVAWEKTYPQAAKGECAYLKTRSSSDPAMSTVFNENCSEKKRFICEV